MTRRTWIWLGIALGSVFLFVLFVVGLFVFAVTRFGAAGDWEERAIQGDGFQKVAMINVTGEIHGGESTPSLLGGGGAGAQDIISQLRQAEEDDNVEAVILRIDSPGGAVVASDEISRAVRRLRADKPVVASMGDLAASGGYYVASQANRIVANPGTITGSIGVIAILFNLEGTAEKLGAEPIVLKSGDLKDAGSPFREFGDRDRAVYERLLDQSYDQFVEAVATGRDMDVADVRELADGRPYSGEDARKNGLVDDFGDLEDAYDTALGLANLDREDTHLVEYRAPSGFGDLFPFGVGKSSAIDEVKRELGLDVGLKYLYLP